MSTLKVNTISNNGTETDTPQGFTIAGNSIVQEYTESASEPSAEPNEGDIWWDTTNSVVKRYISGAWRTITTGSGSSIAWSGDRGIAATGGGTYSGAINHTNDIEYYDITTTGNASTFGNLSVKRGQALGAAGSSSRGIFFGGRIGDNPGGRVNTIDYITISTTGNAQDFGDLTVNRSVNTAAANETRALCAGGWNGASYFNTIDYVTIATTGNALDFGDLSSAGYIIPAGTQDDTRAIFAGSIGTQNSNVIEYVTIATTGNSTDFGDLTESRDRLTGVSNNVRGIIASDNSTNNIEYVTIQTTGNATGFGDLTVSRQDLAGAENATRACFAGGSASGTASNVIDYITMDTTGNATDFGDLVESRKYVSGNSGSAS